MVQDYHYLNEHTVKNNYPLPLIFQLINKLKEAKMFTKMDLWWVYNNVQIKENNEWKAVFMYYHDSFKPLIMFFRLCNSSGTFQAMMNEIFTNIENICIVYINDLSLTPKKNTIRSC